MKNPKLYSRLMSKTKFQASNKTNDIFNQINILNKQILKSKNSAFHKISLNYKTSKNTPRKGPQKSINKNSNNKIAKNIDLNIEVNKNLLKTKLLTKELNNIISNINNRNNIMMNYNSNKIRSETNTNFIYENNKQRKILNNKSTNDSPKNYMNSTNYIIDKKGIKQYNVPDIKEELNRNKYSFNLNININKFKTNKNKKFLNAKNDMRNENIISNFHSNTHTNINTTNIININNNVNNIINNNSNIQYIYTNQNQKKKKLLNPKITFTKNIYRNINKTTPVTMNNSRKTSAEKKIRKPIGINNLNNYKKNSLLNFCNNWMNNNSMNNNLNFQINPNFSNERITYINRSNNIIYNNNIFINKNKINNNKINHTTVNSPNKVQLSSNQIKLKNEKNNNMSKIIFRPCIKNNLIVKIPYNTTANSRDISNLLPANKSSAINQINKNDTNYIISTNFLNLNNNFINKNKNNQNKRCKSKTISQKQSYKDLVETDIKNQTENLECILEQKLFNIEHPKNEYTNNENDEMTNQYNPQYYQMNNNTTNNIIKINNKNPKIIDIKKFIINNNKIRTIKDSNKYNKNSSNKVKIYNLVNNKPNIKLDNFNYKTNLKDDHYKKIINTNTILNSKATEKEKDKENKRKYQKYLDIFEDEKIIIKRNYSNNAYNKFIKSVSKKEPKSLSKSKQRTKLRKKIRINEISSLIEGVIKLKKKKIVNSSNTTSNPSQINSINHFKKNKTVAVTVSNSNNNSTIKNNINFNNNSFLLFEPEQKEKKNILMNQGKYFLKESERLSKYIHDYYVRNDYYPKSQISFYKYGRLIGQGAFGKVNLGLHILTGRFVAIKSFNKNKLKNERARNKIYHEINLMRNLKHSSVVQLLDTFETEKYILLIMENIAGGDLLSFVKKRTKLNEKMSKFIFKQILQALKYIHSKHIVHRDIKLDNVLIDLNNNIKLCDFGVGKMIHENEVLLDQCGTPAYIAPEILVNKGYDGFSVDVWSSGVVLYTMLSGMVPFKANNLSDLQNMIITGSFKEIHGISKDCNDLLHKLLQVNPKKRITIDEALNHPWIQGVEGDNKLTLFTKAEMVLLSKNYFDYRKCTKEEMIENFSLKNLDTKNNIENKNKFTKSIILAPFNTSYMDDELKKTHDEENLNIENNIILFDENINVLNRQYELNNNGEIDHGVLINRSKMSSTRSNKLNEGNKNILKEEELKEKSKSKSKDVNDNIDIEEEQIKKFPENNLKKIINNNKEKENDIINKNKGNIMNYTNTFNIEEILNEDAVKNVEKFGYDKDYIKKCVINNEINYCFATYYLLLNNNIPEIIS